MPQEIQPAPLELDLKRYELRLDGRVLRLEKIPMELVVLLCQRADGLVTREEIIERLWGKSVFLDTEQGIRTAIRKIRLALRDDPEHPRYIQTVVGKGYRLIAPVTIIEGGAMSRKPEPAGDQGQAAAIAVLTDRPHVAQTTSKTRTHHAIRFAGLITLALLLVGWLVGLQVRRIRARAVDPERKIRSVAVLPLANLSGDPAQDYFAEGMTDELITNLAKVSSLQVISRTSVMRYAHAQQSLPEIAHSLNVDAVIEGSVMRSGDNVRITAQLISAGNDRHMWADEYEGELKDVLNLQRNVARDIVKQVKATLTPEEQTHLAATRGVDPQAYELYLKGRSYWNQRTESALGYAVNLFRKAIEIDPTFAQAHSGLADSYTALGYLSYLDPNDVFPRGKTAAVKALELDPTLAEAHASLGYYQLYYAWNWLEAEKEFRAAIKLNPNYASAHEWYSIYLLAMGRSTDAWSEIIMAQQLDPLSAIISSDIGFHYYYTRKYDEAITQLRSTVAANPKFPLAHFWLGRAYQQKSMYAEAIAEFDQVRTVLPTWTVNIAGTGNAYGWWGKTADAEQALVDLNTLSRTRYVTPYGVALVYAGMGKNNEAFVWLNKAVQDRSHWLVWLKLDPRWERLRPDPRFTDLVRRVGLP